MAASSGPKLWTMLAILPRGRALGASVFPVAEEGKIRLLYLFQLSPWAHFIVASGRDRAWLCRPYVPMPRCSANPHSSRASDSPVASGCRGSLDSFAGDRP